MQIETTQCSRCGRTAREDEPLIHTLPEGWEGPPPVCPGCQYVEWHPHCTSLRVQGGFGPRIDIDAVQRGETITVEVDGAPVVFRSYNDVKALDEGEIGWCDYIDMDVSWTDDTDPPAAWRCPECDGTRFEGVHRDYQPSNLKGATFTAEFEEGEGD